jgi:hypothetical protein
MINHGFECRENDRAGGPANVKLVCFESNSGGAAIIVGTIGVEYGGEHTRFGVVMGAGPKVYLLKAPHQSRDFDGA